MDLIVTLQCQDQPGIVHAMTTAILGCNGNIIENQQFTDPVTNTFVMRTRFESSMSLVDAKNHLDSGLSRFNPSIKLRATSDKKRALILVTTESHCLRDLLYLQELGELPVEIPVVVSNHKELQSLVESHGIPFVHLAVDSLGKEVSEQDLQKLISEHKIDIVVLARYMQILSANFCRANKGSIINIHHSF